jgi:hypothetical protein
MYSLVAATESAGYLTCELPVPAGSPGDTLQGAAPGGKPAGLATRRSGLAGPPGDDDDVMEELFELVATTDFRTCVAPTPHFKIHYPSYLEEVVIPDPSGTRQTLADVLESAYQRALRMGVSSQGVQWPMHVLVQNFPPSTKNQYYCVGHPSTSNLVMWCNEGKMGRPELPRMWCAAGRSVFHLLWLLHDRDDYLDLDHFWFHRAAASWSEELFTQDSDYRPLHFAGHERAPFTGLRVGAPELVGKKDTMAHGLGMSALVKYLVGQYGEEILPQIYEKIRNGAAPLEALRDSVEDPVNVWWPGFFVKYVSGEIYGVGSQTFMGYRSGEFDVTESKRKTFSDSYQDLSAKLYFIDLPDANSQALKQMDSSAKIKLDVACADKSMRTEDIKVLVFGLKDGTLHYFRDDPLKVKELAEGGWDLVAVVVNSNYRSDHKDPAEILLEVEVVSAPKLSYNYAVIGVNLRADYTVSGRGVQTYANLAKGWPDRPDYRTPMSGLSGSWATTWTSASGPKKIEYSGSLTVVLDTSDPAKPKVTGFSARETAVEYSQGKQVGTETYSIEGAGLDIPCGEKYSSERGRYLQCSLYGEACKQQVPSIRIAYQWDSADGKWRKLERCDCDQWGTGSNPGLSIFLYNVK